MNILELAGNLEGDDDLKILENPPAKVTVPLTTSVKEKEMSIVPSKSKTGSLVSETEKLMSDALRTRSSKRLAKIEILEGKEMGKKVGSGLSMGTDKMFGPN